MKKDNVKDTVTKKEIKVAILKFDDFEISYNNKDINRFKLWASHIVSLIYIFLAFICIATICIMIEYASNLSVDLTVVSIIIIISGLTVFTILMSLILILYKKIFKNPKALDLVDYLLNVTNIQADFYKKKILLEIFERDTSHKVYLKDLLKDYGIKSSDILEDYDKSKPISIEVDMIELDDIKVTVRNKVGN